MKFHTNGVYIKNGTLVAAEDAARSGFAPAEESKCGTITYGILQSHNVSGDPENLKIYFDAMASHDITYVGIIQTARASGMEKFPIPYVLTNCHNSLCAVGGTINEDDHVFGLSAAKKYGGEFVPAHQAVIHSYMRERYAGGGKMIIGSDSHTRYGAYGTISVGEGGPELARQLLRRTYDIKYPPVVAVHLAGAPCPGVGPQDVALALIGSVFKNGFVKNSVLEFVGPGIKNLSIEYRCGIDVMTTETACLSSVWATDGTVKRALESYGREDDYKELIPEDGAYYDKGIEIDLSEIEPMIALPFHPSNAFTIREFKENMSDILASIDAEVVGKLSLKAQPESLRSKIQNGKFIVDQGVIAGCSGGTYQNLMRAAELLRGRKTGSGAFWLSCYPGSMPVMQALTKNGAIADLMSAGASVRSCFCGPCFGAGDVPANGAFSIRHTTRNFPNREGSRPADGQASYVALMDARSIAATALSGGVLTAATELDFIPADASDELCEYDDSSYKSRVYYGVGMPDSSAELVFGPNITDWPAQIAMPENLVLSVAAAIYDPVTTTDELIPSGETSSYRSNPPRLAEFTLSRKVPEYVGRAKDIQKLEIMRRDGNISSDVGEALMGFDAKSTGLGTLVLAMRPGDGSAREQAASCQRVLGGCANIAQEYATKRYRSNVVNWGMLPFILPELESYGIKAGDRVLIPGIRKLLEGSGEMLSATLVQSDKRREITLSLPGLTREERDIILAGCLINFYA
ncbi:MAG: hydratase [Oscillospiraceae bacterium]|nr:hydratase [Oscillospiraceae bacterium]